MTYQQAGKVAVIYRILGWLITLPALLSTMVSLLLYIAQQVKATGQQGIGTVLADFLHLFIEVMRSSTSFLNIFWSFSPEPHFNQGANTDNVLFFIIYFLIFFGFTLNASGQRLSRQVKTISEGIEDQLILEQLKEQGARNREELEQAVQLTLPALLRQYGLLYISPLFFIIMGYLFFQQLGWL